MTSIWQIVPNIKGKIPAAFLVVKNFPNSHAIFLVVGESFGQRPLGCAVEDLMPDFLWEMAVGCTLILARLCKIGK